LPVPTPSTSKSTARKTSRKTPTTSSLVRLFPPFFLSPSPPSPAARPSDLPINGHLFELDGLKQRPVNHGAIPEGKDWTEVARECVLPLPPSFLPASFLSLRFAAPLSSLNITHIRSLSTEPSSVASQPTLPGRSCSTSCASPRGELLSGHGWRS
jgi:hypothetical protein